MKILRGLKRKRPNKSKPVGAFWNKQFRSLSQIATQSVNNNATNYNGRC
jgi:hypothetical protein